MITPEVERICNTTIDENSCADQITSRMPANIWQCGDGTHVLCWSSGRWQRFLLWRFWWTASVEWIRIWYRIVVLWRLWWRNKRVHGCLCVEELDYGTSQKQSTTRWYFESYECVNWKINTKLKRCKNSIAAYLYWCCLWLVYFFAAMVA